MHEKEVVSLSIYLLVFLFGFCLLVCCVLHQSFAAFRRFGISLVQGLELSFRFCIAVQIVIANISYGVYA